MAERKQDIGILDLLGLLGFDRTCRGKLVRHQHLPRYDMEVLLRQGLFETYQAFQRRPVFETVDRLVSFIGTKGTWARFVGVYDILDRLPASQGVIPPNCPHDEWRSESTRYYSMRRDPTYAALEQRVIIDWGKSTRSWHQRLHNRPVMEILPPGQVLPPFEDYLEFTLTHGELKAVFAAPEAHREWRARLSAVAGVYLIVDSLSGAQYVGSAHGIKGIWGRWETYARNGHGGNVALRRLCRGSAEHPGAFRYSVLQVLPKTFSHAEVLHWEALYKEKLGRKAVSLSRN